MTRFIDVTTMRHMVRQVGIESLLATMVSYIEQDFVRWQNFDKSARTAAHSEMGVIELMPIANDQRYSFKYVNGHPNNTQHQLLTVMAFGVLSEVQTGYPLLLSELTLTTAIRTAAASIVAAKVLARPDSKVMALIGNGSQSEFQAIAFHHIVGINEIQCFDLDLAASEKLKANLNAYPALKVTICESAHQATKGADIITTVTADKKYATIITEDMVAAGVHINGVGGDCPGKTELASAVLNSSSIFVEYEPQTRIEGDIQQLPVDHDVVELWQVLAGKAKGRVHPQQITVFDSVGFALEDFSALRLIYELACRYELGENIELIPHLENTKDLFSLIKEA